MIPLALIFYLPLRLFKISILEILSNELIPSIASSWLLKRYPLNPLKIISGIEPFLWAITGVPQLIASTGALPKGSSHLVSSKPEGNKKPLAYFSNSFFCSSSAFPK